MGPLLLLFGLWFGPLSDDNFDFALVWSPAHLEPGRDAWLQLGHKGKHVLRIAHGLVPDPEQDVARFYSGLVRRTVIEDAGNNRAPRVLQLERVSQCGRDFL